MEKELTIDGLARMTQDEFAAIRKDMKAGFDRLDESDGMLRKDMGILREDMGILRRDMEAGFTGLTETLKEMHADIKDLKKTEVDVVDLRNRVERLERKLGISNS